MSAGMDAAHASAGYRYPPPRWFASMCVFIMLLRTRHKPLKGARTLHPHRWSQLLAPSAEPKKAWCHTRCSTQRRNGYFSLVLACKRFSCVSDPRTAQRSPLPCLFYFSRQRREDARRARPSSLGRGSALPLPRCGRETTGPTKRRARENVAICDTDASVQDAAGLLLSGRWFLELSAVTDDEISRAASNLYV